MRLLGRLVVVAIVAVWGLATLPAHADSEHRQDARGDAPPVIDVRGVEYSHGTRLVRARAHVPGLGRRGSASISISRFAIFEAGYVLQIKKRLGMPARLRFGFFNHFDLEPRQCSGASARWGDRGISLSVPRSCLEGHRTHRLFVQFGLQRGRDIDRAPAVRRLRMD